MGYVAFIEELKAFKAPQLIYRTRKAFPFPLRYRPFAPSAYHRHATETRKPEHSALKKERWPQRSHHRLLERVATYTHDPKWYPNTAALLCILIQGKLRFAYHTLQSFGDSLPSETNK